jgi:molybdenum-dependent DNA-binding transcriptional regulator ModE
MDIVRVRYFLAVCRHGGFSAAARACGVSQPSVTMAVQRLERSVGGMLFERKHPVRLTPLGMELLPVLEDMQSVADRLAAIVERTCVDPLSSNATTGPLGRGAKTAQVRGRGDRDDEGDVPFGENQMDRPSAVELCARGLRLRGSDAGMAKTAPKIDIADTELARGLDAEP